MQRQRNFYGSKRGNQTISIFVTPNYNKHLLLQRFMVGYTQFAPSNRSIILKKYLGILSQGKLNCDVMI